MASARITCPECKTAMRPAKPVPNGKRVKCPECGNIFTTPGLVEEDEPRPKTVAKKKNKAAIKKADGPKPSAKKTRYEDDDEDEGGIYAFVGSEEKKEEKEEDRPDIEYVPDMSIKDLRGPAQAAVIKPSNYMLILGGLNCLADIFIICASFWPMVFSPTPVDWQKVLTESYRKSGDKNADRRAEMYKEYKELKDKDLAIVEEAAEEERKWLFTQMGIFIALFIYHAIATFGAVKMQNLESRRWGIASSIMFILPLGAAGLGCLIAGVFFKTIGAWILDELALHYSIGIGVIVYLVTLIAGATSLRALMSKEVIDGFQYVAD